MREAQLAAKAAGAGGQDLEQEVQEAWEEMQTQRAIVDKCGLDPMCRSCHDLDDSVP